MKKWVCLAFSTNFCPFNSFKVQELPQLHGNSEKTLIKKFLQFLAQKRDNFNDKMETMTEAHEGENLLLADGEETEETEFTSGDVELLLGDDDVNAFGNESFEDKSTISDETGGAAKTEEAKEGSDKSSSHNEGHYSPRGVGRGRFFRGGRGGNFYPNPFFYHPRGLRPPFPGAVPRFGRPPYPFRGGRPPMGFMRYPRGMFMRPPR